MKVASIDIGTNTILLLIAEADKNSPYDIKTIKNYYRMPRIGKDLLPGKNIAVDKTELMKSILKEYMEIISGYGCEQIIISATNAFRIAGNRDELIKIVHDVTGVYPNVITGDDEARYAFLGATGNNNNTHEVSGVIDIGGGSTEITIGNNNGFLFSHSFPFGVVSLTEKHFQHDPPLFNEVENMQEDILEMINILPVDTGLTKLTGVSGTPTSLLYLKFDNDDYSDEFVEGKILTTRDMESLLNRFLSTTSGELAERYPNVLSGRSDVITAGVVILKTIVNKLQLKEIIVSSKGIRYGAVTAFLLNQ